MLPMGLKRAMAAISLLHVAAPFDRPMVLFTGESGGVASKKAVKIPLCAAKGMFCTLCGLVDACVVAGRYKTQDAPQSNIIAASKLTIRTGLMVSGRLSTNHAELFVVWAGTVPMVHTNSVPVVASSGTASS